MKFYNYLFPFIISCFFVSGSFAATGEIPYGPNEEYVAHFGQGRGPTSGDVHGECEGTPTGVCGNGTTCINDVTTGHNNLCVPCVTYREEEYPYSDNYAVGSGACYKFCAPEILKIDIDGDGVLETEVGQIEPEFLTAYNPNGCKDKYVYCNNETDKCNGYHAEGESCVPNMEECTGDHGAGYKFWECNEDGSDCDWSDCLLTQCDENHHLEPTDDELEYGVICNSNTIYGKCVKDTAECASMLGDCENSKGEGGKIDGKAHWTTDGAEIKDAPGKWDFSQCSCTISNESIDGGIGGKKCLYTSSGAWGKSPVIWKKDCEVTEAVSCDVGYCQPNGTTGCQKAPAGYYHDNTADFKCQPCSLGATSPVGSKGENCCYMSADNNLSTRFCDRVGCFNLSELTDNKIPYDNTTCYTVDD